MQKFLTLVVLLVAVSACGDSDSTAVDEAASAPAAPESSTTAAAEDVQLRVGVPFGMVPLAATAPIVEEDAVDGTVVAAESISNPDQLRTGLAAGDLDLAVMPTTVAANLHNRGIDLRLLGVIDAQLLQVLGPAGSTWADLQGETVDLPFQGDIADLVVRDLAAFNDVDVDSIQFRYGTALPDLVGAAASGRVRFAVLPEHFASAAAAQAGASGHDLVPVIDVQDAWSEDTSGDRLPQIGLVASASLVAEHPDITDALAELVAAHLGEIASAPTPFATGLAEATGLPAPLLESVLPRLDLGFRSASAARADLDALFGQVAESAPEVIGGSSPPAAFFGK